MERRLIEVPCFDPPVGQRIENPLARRCVGDLYGKTLPRGPTRALGGVSPLVLLGDLRQACARLPARRQDGIEIPEHGEPDRSGEFAHLAIQAPASRFSLRQVEVDDLATPLRDRRWRKYGSPFADAEWLRDMEGEHLNGAPCTCWGTLGMPAEGGRRIQDQGHTGV